MTEQQRRVIVVDRAKGVSELHVGRGPRAGLSVDEDPLVSNVHALLRVDKRGDVRIVDRSLNGTFLDGLRVTDATISGPGRHVLRVGHTDIDLVVR